MEDWGEVLRAAHEERNGYQASISAAETRAREAEREAPSSASRLIAARTEAEAR